MATLYTHQDSNVQKTWLLMALFLVIIIGLGFVFSYIYESPGIFYIALIFSILMNITSYWFSDKIVLGMYRAEHVTDTSHPDLYNVVENLAITAGLPMPKVYVIPDSAPNAFATGRNKEHAAVAVTSGLLQILNKTELEGVIAHELTHVDNSDILLGTVIVVLVGFIALISDIFMRGRFSGGRRGGRGGGNLGGILMLVGIVLAILSPIIAKLIQLAISRKREFLADASGALLTRYPEGLASALEKINSVNVPMQKANHATAHLFIANPFGGESARGFLNKLFLTHPPAEERIQILRDMK